MKHRLTEIFHEFKAYGRLEEPADTPWLLDGWLWATQGRFIVALRDDGSPSNPPPERFLKARHYLTDVPDAQVPCSLAKLKAFGNYPVAKPTGYYPNRRGCAVLASAACLNRIAAWCGSTPSPMHKPVSDSIKPPRPACSLLRCSVSPEVGWLVGNWRQTRR